MNYGGYWMISHDRTRRGIKTHEVYYRGTLIAQFKDKLNARLFMMAVHKNDQPREESDDDRTESVHVD